MLNPDESISAGHSLAQDKDVNVQSMFEHAGWRCTDEYVAASDVAHGRRESRARRTAPKSVRAPALDPGEQIKLRDRMLAAFTG